MVGAPVVCVHVPVQEPRERCVQGESSEWGWWGAEGVELGWPYLLRARQEVF